MMAARHISRGRAVYQDHICAPDDLCPAYAPSYLLQIRRVVNAFMAGVQREEFRSFINVC
jgi:hypothetical protein